MGFVDPDLLGKLKRNRRPANEAIGVGQIGCVEDGLTLLPNDRRLAVMDHGGRHHSDAGVTVVVVVPNEERLAEGAAVLNAAEAIRKLGTILHGVELAFRIRIVVGGVGPAVGFGDAEIGQQEGHRLAAHGRAAVGVDGELAGAG